MNIDALNPADELQRVVSQPDSDSGATVYARRRVGDRELKRVVLASVLGSFVEWFEFSVYGYLASIMGRVFFPASTPGVQLIASLAAFAIAFFARPFGGLIFGPMGDRYGRKKVLTATIILMAVATFCIGLIPDHATIGVAAPALLIIFRLLQGVSAGGEASGAAIFVAEYCPDRNRTAITSWIEVGCMSGFCFGAVVVAALTHFFSVAQIDAWAWRLPFLLALPLGGIGLYIRYRLEETPAFEAAQHRTGQRAGWRYLFRTHAGPLLQSSGLIIVTNVTLFTVVTYTPTYLVSTLKLDASTGLTISLVSQIFLVAMIPLLGALADRIGRKTVMLSGVLAVAVLVVPCFHLLMTGSFATRLAALALLNLCLAAMLSCIFSKVPSLFETSVRFTGMAISYNVSVALFAGTAPMINAWLIQATGSRMIPAYYLIAAAAVGVVALLFCHDRTGKPMHGDAPVAG
ncbi:MFS transporter [Paraburkholderia megapolitana]|uniref:MFS transporter, MHS family, proline/betaine transporter n=1 Tax=Paraburkholderia megapolitana TaxID=420953 RepID=A0A1I3IQB3_9BURK|nr:MFS transporter [Paraburkholderia megapolitana]QDQ85092.1 MFS transporter [Paraburkholderia megapolitana]SFI50146.1 MFS transporter, MHS family, proline/betaine transporter [Paraburkholderia megapolitana]